MKILGIDYGRSKIGLAIAEDSIAQPLRVIKVLNWEDALGKVEQVVKIEQVEQVVIGVSEGKMGEEQQKFAQELTQKLALPVTIWDEGLSTFDAQRLSVELGQTAQKRQKMEDAYAAAIVLQSWLEGRKNG